jgi:hypothetical protein
MTRCESLDGPIYWGGAVVIDGGIQVAWLRPNATIILRDPMAGWTALQHGFRAAPVINRYVRSQADD